MQRADVNQVNLVALPRKPAGMTAGSTSDIENRSWCRREKALEKLTRTFAVKFACTRIQSVGLISGGVVFRDLCGPGRM